MLVLIGGRCLVPQGAVPHAVAPSPCPVCVIFVPTVYGYRFKGMCLANPSLSPEDACAELERLHDEVPPKDKQGHGLLVPY